MGLFRRVSLFFFILNFVGVWVRQKAPQVIHAQKQQVTKATAVDVTFWEFFFNFQWPLARVTHLFPGGLNPFTTGKPFWGQNYLDLV